ncbi:NADH-ubiquinone oxidoreductase-F iron-sulfur binding region domain-containing protein [Halovivax sp.]|uniref:NADH-ubiquinone oxidoreductase-F iron-sulfur binding region domain-containing protein n=1 Tax=Halovivax sp. TaxID=1935978 RepID=UPI0025C0D868|nr:NADH-ubiquinone oxidoreductase-F iron-sulfur binding region domain-containing protein [Halovivax sp.]
MSPSNGAAERSPALRVSSRPSLEKGAELVATAREADSCVRVLETGPTGIEGAEPLVLATVADRTAVFTDPDESTIRNAVGALDDGTVPDEAAETVIRHEPNRSTIPIPDDGALAVGDRRVLGPCGWVEPTSPDDLELVSVGRDASEIGDLGLLGRGRGDAVADEPAADAWERARETDGEAVVVVNAHRTDVRPRADRTLLAGAPLAVLDGAAAVAERVGASDVIVHLAPRDEGLGRLVRRAADAAHDALSIDPQVVVGPDEYRAGAPTAALEALEGADRIEPRIQPPTPAEYGLHGRPTVVHTPRTLAQVRHALAEPGAYDSTAADPGTRLVTVTGDVVYPATIELPPDTSLTACREAVTIDGRFELACVGGVFGGIVRDLDVAPTARSLAAAELGTDGVVELLNETRCPVATAGERARFAAEANSGRCVPGREGTRQLLSLLRDVYDGRYAGEDIRELARVMAGSANCQVGAHAPRPVTTAMEEFEPAFRAHADGRCPSGTCTGAP